MGKPFLWICCVTICVALAGCEADHSLVQEPDTGYTDADGYAVGTPYWWRTHPYYKDIKVDEEATLAVGDPYLVIHADEEDELDAMYDKLIEALREEYEDEVVGHLLGYHRDYVLSLTIPGVNMSLMDLIIPPPTPPPNVVVYTHCECPWEWEGSAPPEGCDPGGGGSPPPPPAPPPDPRKHSYMQITGDYIPPNELPAQRSVMAYISTVSLNGVSWYKSKLMDVRIEKDGIPAYLNPLHQKLYSTQHILKKSFSYGDALPVVWVATAKHEVRGIITGLIWTAKTKVDVYY